MCIYASRIPSAPGSPIRPATECLTKPRLLACLDYAATFGVVRIDLLFAGSATESPFVIGGYPPES